MKRLLFILLLPVLIISVVCPNKLSAQDKACIVCHTGITTGKVVHQPITQACLNCHKSNGQTHPQEDVKGFDLSKPMPSLCYQCHTPLNTKQYQHPPVSNGKCMLCHTPHTSDHPSLQKEYPEGPFCMECHDNMELEENKVSHPPVTEGKCNACHDPHQSDVKKLLKQEGQSLCLSCHPAARAEMTNSSVHAPFKNKCTVCHAPHGAKEDYMLTQPLTELCFACHDNMPDEYDNAAFPHKALKEGKSCIACHSPHSSNNKSLMREASVAKGCASCHSLDVSEKKVKHAAFTGGQCLACHSPHYADQKKLMRGPTPTVCTTCHEKEKEELAMTYVHGPFRNNCSTCHTSHASDEKSLLTKDPASLCLGCHDEFEEPLELATSIHQPFNNGRACMNCHSPHASNVDKKLLKEQTSLCMDCHDKTLRRGNEWVANIKAEMQKKFVHTAVTKNGCNACHNPHLSENSGLLTAAFPKTFYTPAEKDSFALCFTCHDPQLMLAAKTVTATAFRNGERNLHFAHINGKKARSCAVCHELHAADNKHLLTDKIPFGNWTMKMTFLEGENGGTCQTGCHSDKTYKR